MGIKISFELDMTPDDLRSWANEYGLEMDEAASDAAHHLGELVREHVKAISQVQEFAKVKNYQVR